MAASTTELFADLKAELTAIRAGQERLEATLAGHGDILRLLLERMDLVIAKLYPDNSDGPTLQELLAELVVRVGDNGIGIHRIDRRTESMADSLVGDIVLALTGMPIAVGAGASGNGAHSPGPGVSGDNGNGHAP